MSIRNQLEYSAVAALLGLCRVLPEAWVYGIFRALGHLAFSFLIGRRTMALNNMRIAFPDKDRRTRKRLVRRNFVNLADAMAVNAMIMNGRISNDELMAMIEADDWARFEQICANAENDVLVFSAHLGNWELLPQYTALRSGRKLAVIARKSNNPIIEEKVIRPLRERFGVIVFYKENAILNLMKASRKGNLIGLLVDQRLGLKKGIPVEFFGKTAATTATPALMQIRFGYTTLPIFIVKQSKPKYRMIIGDSIEWADNGEPMEQQVEELTRIHQKIIEDTIRAYPDQWFWMHDRWRMKQRDL